LNLKYGDALSNVSFNFSTRRYREGWQGPGIEVQQLDAIFYESDVDYNGCISFDVGPGRCCPKP